MIGLDLENHIVEYADHSESYYDEEDCEEDDDYEFDDIEEDDDIEE